MPELTDAEVFGTKELSDADVFGAKELTDAEVFSTPASPFQSPQAAPFSPGRESSELGLYTPRVQVPDFGLPPSEGSRISAINSQVERMNAQELRAIDAEHPGVAIPTEVPATELPRNPIELPRFQADERASIPAKIGVGLYNTAAGLVEFPINPEGAAITAATAGSGAAGGVTARLGGAAWAAYGAKETPHLVREAKKALETGTAQQKTEALAALGINTLITAGGARTALKPNPILTPEQVARAQEQARTASLPSREPLPEAPKAPETPAAVPEPVPSPENAPTGEPRAVAGTPEVPLGVNRPEIVDPKLRDLPDSEFDALYRERQKAVDAQEKKLDEGTASREEVAKAQDEWSAVDNERYRRNWQDIHPNDLLREMLKQADLNRPDLVRLLAEEMRRQKANPQDMLSEIDLRTPDQAEVFKGKLGKVRAALEEPAPIPEQPVKAAEGAPVPEQAPLAPEATPPVPKEAAPVPEPAISFPGIGSLREKQATAMELGKIRKAEPELWKAITQMFGTTIPARVATLAKQRFEQQKAAPTPTEPPLGGAMTMGVDPIATARAVQKLFNEVRQNETVDRITRQVAGESAPHTMAASESSGEALIRFASARGTGRLMGRAKATEVLGDKAKDEAFRKKLGAVIVEDQLRATKQKFQELSDKAIDPTEKAELQDMADKAGAAGSPFKDDAAFQAALNDPEIQTALQRHKEIIQPIAEEAHKMLGGKMMTAGESTGTFANLIAILGEEKAGQVFGGGRGELTRPRKRPSKFFFERKGTALEYETDYQKIASRMVEGNFDEVAKRELYEQLESDGLAVAAKPGIPAPEIGGKKTVKFEIQRRGTPGGQTQTENLWVREDVARELRQALDVDGPVARAGWVRAASIANAIQLAGPTDAVFHMANMLSSITRSQGGRNALVDLGRKIPGVNIADTLVRLGASVMRVVRDSPEIQTRIAELSDIGAMRPLKDYERRQITSRAIQTLDIAGRLVREDLFNNLVKRRLVEDTPANRREWVNQLGQYNPRLMGQFQRMMRDFGVSPFVVAGRNFNRNAIRSLLLSQGVKTASPRAWAVMKAVDVAGFAMAMFAVPMLLNYWLTGDPKGRPGTKVGEIDTGKGNIKIDPLQWTGIRRGARITGIDAIANGQRWNSSSAETKYAAGRDVVNGLLHPWMGPVPKAGAIATTGYGSVGFKESENPKDWAENLKAAAEQLNPVVKSIAKGWEEKADTAESGVPEKAGAAVASTVKSLAGALGVKERRQRTALQQLKGIQADWLAQHPSAEVRKDYERGLTEQRALPKYMGVYTALRERDAEALKKAVKDLRDAGVKLSEIRDQLQPIVQSGENAGLQKELLGPSRKLERQFRNSLTPAQRKLYNDALAERQAQWRFWKRYF